VCRRGVSWSHVDQCPDQERFDAARNRQGVAYDEPAANRRGPRGMLGFFVVALDAQVVNVALPDMRTGQGVAWPGCSGS
jgi:hypothetical protein